jgi:hypothetical protein
MVLIQYGHAGHDVPVQCAYCSNLLLSVFMTSSKFLGNNIVYSNQLTIW